VGIVILYLLDGMEGSVETVRLMTGFLIVSEKLEPNNSLDEDDDVEEDVEEDVLDERDRVRDAGVTFAASNNFDQESMIKLESVL
jgi:hypothetical protein